MKRFLAEMFGRVSLVAIGCAWMGLGSPVQAATVTDTFELKLTIKRWCEGNPKYFENLTVKIDPKNPSANATMELTWDTNGSTDIQGRIDTKGKSTDMDLIPLFGRALLSNTSQTKAEAVLSGVNPGNADHFVTLRGQASFDKTHALTKVTGTFMVQETNTYTVDKKTGQQSESKECFASGTFSTGKKVPGGGSVIVVGAPQEVGGSFVALKDLTRVFDLGADRIVTWGEGETNGHSEAMGVTYSAATGVVSKVTFTALNGTQMDWGCVGGACVGAVVNQSSGKLTLNNVELQDPLGLAPPITLNGVLTFAPF